MADDFYKILGIRRDASQAEIQKAYRELARKYHPDMNPGDKTAKAKFQEVQKAFDVLNDAEKREMYDRYGSSFETRGSGGPRPRQAWGGSVPPGAGGAEGFDFSQFFGERFGEEPAGGFADLFTQFRHAGGGRARKTATTNRRRGTDLHHEIEIAFQTAMSGGQVQLQLARASGKTETLTVKIPPGIEDGKKIRLRGQGEPGARGATAGDLLLTVRVAAHPCFHRQGNHLHVKLPVTLAEAALGAKVDVPTPKGTVALSIPPGTSSGTKLRLKGHGVASTGGASGDLLAEVQIVLPKEFDDADRKALEELAQRHPQEPRLNLRW